MLKSANPPPNSAQLHRRRGASSETCSSLPAPLANMIEEPELHVPLKPRTKIVRLRGSSGSCQKREQIFPFVERCHQLVGEVHFVFDGLPVFAPGVNVFLRTKHCYVHIYFRKMCASVYIRHCMHASQPPLAHPAGKLEARLLLGSQRTSLSRSVSRRVTNFKFRLRIDLPGFSTSVFSAIS